MYFVTIFCEKQSKEYYLFTVYIVYVILQYIPIKIIGISILDALNLIKYVNVAS